MKINKILNERVLIVISTVLFVSIFNLTYSKLIAPVYESWGSSENATPITYLLVSWILSVLPSLWMPVKLDRPSQFLFLIQYYVIFIPACFVLYNSSIPYIPPENVFNLVLLLFAGLSIIQSTYFLDLGRPISLQIKSWLYWRTLFIVMIGFICYTIYSFVGNFRLANLEEIYTVRSALADSVEDSGSRFGFYAQMWLAGFFFPLYAGLAMYTGRRWMLLFVAAGYLLLFGIGGSKSTILTFFYFPVIFCSLKLVKNYRIPLLIFSFCILISLGFLLDIFELTEISYWYVAIVNYRIWGIPALLIGQYYEFFSQNPVTYMSHVSGINYFISYPYDMDLPRIIGTYFYGFPVGSNAGFWAGDGIASFGPHGIIFISTICAIIFWVFDNIAKRFVCDFVIIAMAFIATSFGNISIFTLISSGGFGLLIIALAAMPASRKHTSVFRPIYIQG